MTVSLIDRLAREACGCRACESEPSSRLVACNRHIIADAIRAFQAEAAKVARGHWPKCCDEDRDEYAEVAEEIAAKIEAL